MNLTINKYINARIGNASTNAPCQFYKSPGDTIEAENVIVGTEIEGNSIWYQNKTDGCFYWSGGIEDSLPAYFKDFGISTLWNETMGEGVKVFVIDSGFKNCDSLELPETDLFSIVPNSEIIDIVGHGTFMANIIGSRNANNLGIAMKSEICCIKITDDPNSINENFLLQALNKVSSLLNVNDYCVINLSLTLGISNAGSFDLIRTKLLSLLDRNNLLIIAAVGNNDLFGNNYTTFPASVKDVVSVAGLNTGPSYSILTSSNYWTDITTAAPGNFPNTNLKSIFPNLAIQGSSHATAFVSGIAALVLSKAKKKNQNINGTYFNSFLQKASTQESETISEDTYLYNKLNKNNLINQFKLI